MTAYKKILVAIDFSNASEKLLEKALNLSAIYDSEIVLAHAIDYSPPSYLSVEIPEIYASKDIMIQRAEENMKEMISKKTDMEIPVIVRVGSRKSTMLEIIQETGADLAIYGKHDPSMGEKIIGSTTHAAVNNANCDILIIHVQ